MIIEIIGWALVWIFSGLATQLAIRLVNGDGLLIDPQHYFWSTVAGPIVLILWALIPLIELYSNLKKP